MKRSLVLVLSAALATAAALAAPAHATSEYCVVTDPVVVNGRGVVPAAKYCVPAP